MKNLYENYFINQHFMKVILHINVENKNFLKLYLKFYF